MCIWFVMVTFSTVGYGEYTPSDWPAQTFVMIMIACAIIMLPIEVRICGGSKGTQSCMV